MTDLSFHLAPNAPWIALLLVALALAALGVWAYRFRVPPLPALARRALTALRVLAFVALALLLAQPVLERASGAGPARLVVLLDRSTSMALPASPGGPARAALAERAVRSLERAWGGRARLEVVPFASRLAADTSGVGARGATALGDAIAALPATPAGRRADGVVVVSDGAVNAGADPATAARALGLPVHAVVIGSGEAPDRAVTEVETPATARVGEATPVRVHVTTSEPRGTPVPVRVLEDGRELARATVIAPGGGAEAVAELRVTPAHAGLAVWQARVDSLRGDASRADDARLAAVEVAPGRLGVLIVSAAPNWDLTFLRRALAGDSSLAVRALARDRDGWRELARARRVDAPGAGELKGIAVVVLDGLAPTEVSAAFDRALADFARGGGGLLLLGGPAPGVTRFGVGALAAELKVPLDPDLFARSASPAPTAGGRELTAWDDDPARGEGAWRAAAPLSDLAPVALSAADRVLIAASAPGPPLMFSRRIGRGQALFVNGTGVWRWSLTSHDELSAERGRRLWRRITRWLAEPVQGEPLRVRAERLVTASGETVRLFATLQDDAFKPVAGAAVEGTLRTAGGRERRVTFEPRGAGAYEAALDGLPPGRWSVSASARKAGRELGRSRTEFAVDRWSLEEARVEPDSAGLAAMAQAAGGRVTGTADVERWARALPAHALARRASASVRLWESPWVFALIVAMLSVEWAWRRRRGLP